MVQTKRKRKKVYHVDQTRMTDRDNHTATKQLHRQQIILAVD